jgi:FAD/FMN-containing dehydrogenase
MAALGLRPSLLDYGEEHASPWPELLSRDEEPPTLFLGFEGYTQEVDASLFRAERIVKDEGGTDLPWDLVREFWEDRHVVAERFQRGRRERGGNWMGEVARDWIHVALPPSAVLPFRQRCHAETASRGIALLECGLWTGPELFSCVLAAPMADNGFERLNTVVDTLLMAAQDLGGSMEYVHGAGVRYAHLMQREHGAGLDLLRRIKVAVDENSILNPDKLGL